MIGREFKFDGAPQHEPFVLSQAQIYIAEDLARVTEFSVGQIALSMAIEPAVGSALRVEKLRTEDGKIVELLGFQLDRPAKMVYDICRLKPDWLDNLEEDLPVACGFVAWRNPPLRPEEIDHKRIAASLAGLLSGIYLQQFYDSGIHLTENEMRNIQKTIDKLEEMSDAK